MNWKRFTIVSVSAALLLLLTKIVVACSDTDDPYDYFTSFFLDDVNDQPAFVPFHYTNLSPYFDEYYDFPDKDLAQVPDKNLDEWLQYTGNTISKKEISDLIYRAPLDQLSNLYYHLEKGQTLKISDSVANNGMTKWLEQSKDLEALGYLLFAKKCEPYVSNGGNEWSTPERDSVKMTRMAKDGLQLYTAAKKDFIRHRYAYQVLRLDFYSGQNKKTLSDYETLIGDQKWESIIYARCLGIKAGALFRTGKKTEAAYYYSLAFDQSDEIKRSAEMSYTWAVGADQSDKVLAFCKNDHEKAVVSIMDGLYHFDAENNNELQVLQKAYSFDPAVNGLEVVMTRAVNRMEENFLNKYLLQHRNVYSFGPYGYAYAVSPDDEYFIRDQKDRSRAITENKSQIIALAQFAKKVTDEGKTNDPAYWYLASSYLNLMANNLDQCEAALDKTKHFTLTPRQADLRAIIGLLCGVVKPEILNGRHEEQLTNSMQWLESKKDKDRRLGKAYRYLLNAVLADKYLSQHDTTKMILSVGKLKPSTVAGTITTDYDYSYEYLEDFTDEPGQLLQLISIDQLELFKSFLRQKNKNSFEQWLTTPNIYTASVISEMEGTRYLRMLQFDSAVAQFEQVDPAEMQLRLIPDPFVLHIKDNHNWDAHDSANSYTKLEFAKKMAELQQGFLDPHNADGPYRMALGLYSMTYYGRAAHAYCYYRSGSDQAGYYTGKDRSGMNDWQRNYYSAEKAQSLFLATADLLDNEEFKARCIYMAAMCWQKNIPDNPDGHDFYSGDDKYYYQQCLENPYFTQFLALNKTTFFSQAAGECTYLRDYLKRQK